MNASIIVRPDVLGIVIGVIGIILAFVFYFRSKEKSRPCYAAVRRVLIGSPNSSLPPEIEITYQGQKISSLYRTVIYFWNAGTKTLDHEDVASSDPIVFHFDGDSVKVLEIWSVKSTRSVVSPSAIQKGNNVELSFDFLDRGDGVAIEIFHTGTDARIYCAGTVKGVTKGIVRQAAQLLPNNKLSLSFGWIPAKSTATGFGASAGGLVIGLSIILGTGIKIKHGHPSFDYVAFIFGILFTIFALAALARSVISYREERMQFRTGYMRDDG
jgi:hypothetical protein